ncbi:hypothetical protein MBRA1_001270 [Malassezia brasiliensis]|uniref:G-patch domain-containing protein n=1 Tax=Malassezia brasiliensis TaxID=1821822 RepID=A0AAF0IN66_9BASI|nr:hypothetical protein MBRA1_001270 [Malassezia brasiliensis]
MAERAARNASSLYAGIFGPAEEIKQASGEAQSQPHAAAPHPTGDERDRARARAVAEAYGELDPESLDTDEMDEPRTHHPRKKPRKAQSTSASALVRSMNADYDPAVPNDYTQFRAFMNERRHRHADANGSALGRPPARPNQDVRAASTESTPRPPRSNSTVEEKRREVAAIAAKFAPASKPEPRPSSSVDPSHRPDPARFAERLMERYGYKKGEGIGAEGNKGMVRPLEARVAKRGTARGVIVNRDRDETAIAREMYGEPSEIVAFDLALDSDSGAAQGLQQDVGDLCAEHGYVHRAILHPMPGLE